MGVILRQRQKTDRGKISLFLDISHNGKRWTKFLKIYLHPEPTSGRLSPKLKADNREKLAKAEAIRTKYESDLVFGEYGFVEKNKGSANFIEYFEALTTGKKKKSAGNYGNWDSALKHLIKYNGGSKIKFTDISPAWVSGFKNYLDTDAFKKSKEPLSANTKLSYFNKLKAALNQAVNDGIISKNPAVNIKGFKEPDSHREYLTLDELKKIASAECELPILKKSFLFSCLTGLRFSDVSSLTWKQLESSSEEGYYLRFTQQKTKGVTKQYIQPQAVKLLGPTGEPEEKIFKGLYYSAHNNKLLRKWVHSAGISKHITFHSARHTFATLLITLDVDLYTVSKLLGHSDVKITQIYAKLIDKKKREAIDKVPDLGIEL
ncbi:site-specific integrase [Pontibacter korlensis]|uniref:Tyr recombinase domain-containing protein n=1 Tax=Pontibacter korlensis TaxID=400092 RepID=A0A0E3UYD6_9BACT|nr:site-specific integrase [Pontibacter korlensis]AKD04381.1 hypothetical protein PKOR_16415 [Pontibacter korlensis]